MGTEETHEKNVGKIRLFWGYITEGSECCLELSANESEKWFPLSNFINLHERVVFM